MYVLRKGSPFTFPWLYGRHTVVYDRIWSLDRTGGMKARYHIGSTTC